MLTDAPPLADPKAAARALQLRMCARLGAAHLIGAVIVFLYLNATLGPPRDEESSFGLSVLLFTVVFVGTSVVVTWLEMRLFDRACGWYCDGREPTPEERSATMGAPLRLAVIPFLGWVVAAVVFGGCSILFEENVVHSIRVTDGILLGGMTTCALGFLLVERAFRPVFAAALADQPSERSRSLGVRPRLLLSWAVGSGVPLLAIALAPFTHEPGANVELGTAVAVLALIGLGAGLLATSVAAKSVAEPVDDVRVAMARVQAGDLKTGVVLDDGGEIGLLQSGFNRMVAGLRERERLRDLFGRHVGSEVAVHALEAGSGLGGEQRDVSTLVVDLIGSTALAEVLPPSEVVATLNEFFGAVVEAVSAEGGWVNKFQGDGALCVFGAPGVQPDHAARALRAARSIQARVAALGEVHPGLDAAVGVSSGPAVAGNVGTDTRYEYTVIGRPVNESARLSELAKARPSRVLASGASIERAHDEAASWIDRGTVALRGQSVPTGVFEPVPARVTAS